MSSNLCSLHRLFLWVHHRGHLACLLNTISRPWRFKRSEVIFVSSKLSLEQASPRHELQPDKCLLVMARTAQLGAEKGAWPVSSGLMHLVGQRYGHCCCLHCWREHQKGPGSYTLQCQTGHSGYFGSLPREHHMQLSVQLLVKWSGYFLFKEVYIHSKGPYWHWQLGLWFRSMQNRHQTLPCLFERRPMFHILFNI